jgi:hypothetical protein
MQVRRLLNKRFRICLTANLKVGFGYNLFRIVAFKMQENWRCSRAILLLEPGENSLKQFALTHLF